MLNRGAGVRAAAIRKLPHELGIPASQLKAEDFTFLTRIHYLAPSDGLWGEHESELVYCTLGGQPAAEQAIETSSNLMLFPVDYILFCTLDVDVDINSNEVSDARYVSKMELEDLFKEQCKQPLENTSSSDRV